MRLCNRSAAQRAHAAQTRLRWDAAGLRAEAERCLRAALDAMERREYPTAIDAACEAACRLSDLNSASREAVAAGLLADIGPAVVTGQGDYRRGWPEGGEK